MTVYRISLTFSYKFNTFNVSKFVLTKMLLSLIWSRFLDCGFCACCCLSHLYDYFSDIKTPSADPLCLSRSKSSIRLIRSWNSLALLLIEDCLKENHFTSNLYSRAAEDESVLMVTFHRSFPFSPFLFNFFIEIVMELDLSSYENSGINIYSNGKLWELGYMDNLVLLSKEPNNLQIFFDRR